MPSPRRFLRIKLLSNPLFCLHQKVHLYFRIVKTRPQVQFLSRVNVHDFKPFVSFNPLPEEVECQVKSADAAFLLTRAKADLARRSLAERNVVVGFVIKTGSSSSFVSVKICKKN